MTDNASSEAASSGPARSILQEASELINGDRAQTYGDVTDNFGRIGDLWNAYLAGGRVDSAYDVANLMILVKLARIKNAGYHRDSYADIAGYAALTEKVNDESACSPCAPVAQSFWDAIDQDILEAQEKRERETTSKPPRVWKLLADVPEGVYAYCYGDNPAESTPLIAEDTVLYDHLGPFTEALGYAEDDE